MRQVALVIETTGIDPSDKIIEIAAVEMQDGVATGHAFNVMINPDMEMAEEANKLHHIASADLQRFQDFSHAAQKLLDFVKDAEVLVYFTQFALPIINAELGRAGHESLQSSCVKVSDVWAMSKKVFPKVSNSMDDVALRYGLLSAKREDRQGMRDARLLADVYSNLKQDAAEKGISLQPKAKKAASHAAHHAVLFAAKSGPEADAVLIDRTHAVNPQIQRGAAKHWR